MKYLMICLLTLIVGIPLSNLIDDIHYNAYLEAFIQCRDSLIADNNYKTSQQAFDCAESDLTVKILGTILFKEGSILK